MYRKLKLSENVDMSDYNLEPKDTVLVNFGYQLVLYSQQDPNDTVSIFGHSAVKQVTMINSATVKCVSNLALMGYLF